ncbi:DUF2325 domain-containing protein [Variovorax sp. KK3]|uniref:DUF2325 domain-containing protein n=1 Tax=Variovorax sp. KK3 TaxID=1855728 RepID=UPI00097C569C|nr:DUF2325 domain-containing protein [Variovorax sp. KK3]
MTLPTEPAPAFRLKYPTAQQAPWPAMPDDAAPPPGATRVRLGDLETHLHCSVVGTCLTDAELRRVIARFVDVQGASELDVHHDAVRLCSKEPLAAKALHKALDRLHDPAVRRFAKARDAAEVEALWREFVQRGEVPGAYWAVLSHRHTPEALRQQVFGEVHMLSHLMGASTRADLRQRVFLQAENEQLRAQLAQLQDRHQRLVETHDRAEQEHRHTAAQLKATRTQVEQAKPAPATGEPLPAGKDADWVTLQVQRRERAELQAQRAVDEIRRLQEESDGLRSNLGVLARELHAAESQLHRWLADDEASTAADLDTLKGTRLLYVGGRPSSSQAIREWVERGGGELRRHDGGLEDRKGQLVASIGWADRVLFPVDCIDHDSANSIKRQCLRLGIPFLPLRTASLASFVAALSQADAPPRPQHGSHLCLRHA